MFGPGEENVAFPLQYAQGGSAEGLWIRSMVVASPSHEFEADLVELVCREMVTVTAKHGHRISLLNVTIFWKP